MNTRHSTFQFAGHTVHRIDFVPSTFTDADLLWLPHYPHIQEAGRKRKTEHLAGRIAAVHALKTYAVKEIPGMGNNGEPLWPVGIVGSITHSREYALAIATDDIMRLVGIDSETIIDENEANEIKYGVISPEEERLLKGLPLPFSLALTLVFSAKESLFKALFSRVNALFGFECARVTGLNHGQLTLSLTGPLAGFPEATVFTVHWLQQQEQVVTFICH